MWPNFYIRWCLFFLCLGLSDWSKFLHFQKNCVMRKIVLWSKLFSPFIWEIDILFADIDLLTAFLNAQYQEHINLNFLCCHDDFVTTPWQWWTGRGSPSSSLLILGDLFSDVFLFFFIPPINSKSANAFHAKQKKKANDLIRTH